jgi:hypothetical protein
MDLKKLEKDVRSKARKQDTARFNKANKLILGMSEAQARFALLKINQNLRGYLMMPERQEGLIDILKRSKKARD